MSKFCPLTRPWERVPIHFRCLREVGGGQITSAFFESFGNNNIGFPPAVTCCSLGLTFTSFAVEAGLSPETGEVLSSQDAGLTFTPVPLPGALPLFATGLGALGLLGWRRKKVAAG